MSRPLLLDLFCGAGGTSMGYHMAGFDVVGIDKNPQPHYPFRFIQTDALKALASRRFMANFVAVHASPPCQGYSTLDHLHRHIEREYLIDDTRMLLEELDLPWIIENVPGAPLLNPVWLCGSSFGLRVRRHRQFESNVQLQTPPCAHEWQNAHKPYLLHGRSGKPPRRSGVLPVYGHESATHAVHGQDTGRFHFSVGMGIDWMNRAELAQAIPPAYTLHLGQQLMRAI